MAGERTIAQASSAELAAVEKLGQMGFGEDYHHEDDEPEGAAGAAGEDGGETGSEGEDDAAAGDSHQSEGEEGAEDEGVAGDDAEYDENGDPIQVTKGDDKPVHEIKVDGKTQKVSLNDLKRGYMRGADYTAKTTELKGMREQVEGHFQQRQAVFDNSLTQLDIALGSLAELVGQEPDWSALLATGDTNAYLATRNAYERQQNALTNAVQTRQLAVQQVLQQQANARAQALQLEGAKLLDAIPEWRSEQRQVADRSAIKAFLRKTGFNDAEIGNIADHRAVVVARKAMLYDQIQRNKQQVQRQRSTGQAPQRQATMGAPPQRQRPQASTQGQNSVAVQKTRERFAKSHSLNDAADLLTLKGF